MAIPAGDLAKRHQHLVKRIAALTLNQNDPLLLTLIMSIIIYTPDFLDLDHPKAVEQMQMNFASLLYR